MQQESTSWCPFRKNVFLVLPPGVYCMHFDERDTLAVQKAAVSYWKRSMTDDIQSHLLGTESSRFLLPQFVMLQHISAEEDGTLSWSFILNMSSSCVAYMYLTKLNPLEGSCVCPSAYHISETTHTARHVSGILMPIIRSSVTAVAASGFTVGAWW